MSDGLGAEPDGSSRRMRVAEVFDGRGPTGAILINRPQVEPLELAALTAYLTKAPVALATTKTGEDEMAPGAGLVVPRAYHTDGEWIWPAAVGYYLHRYRLPPQHELVEHIRARGFRVRPVPEELRQSAAAQMLEELAAAKRAAATGGGTTSGPGPAPISSGTPAGPGSGPGPARGPGASGASPNVWATGTWTPSAPAPAPPPTPAPAPEPAATAAVSNAVPPLVGPTPPAPAVEPAEPSLWLPAPAGEPAIESVPEPTPAPVSVFEPARSAAQARVEPVSVFESGKSAVQAQARVEHIEGEGFSAAFTAAGNRHAAWVYEQIETFMAFMPVDEWSVDHNTGRYRQAGREFTVDALGRLGRDGRWIWAWAEAEVWSPNPALTEHSRRLRDLGDRLGIKELTEPALDLAAVTDAEDPETAAEMLAWTAMGVADARGYIGHTFSDDNRVYYLAFDESIPTARPDLDAAAHYLTQGVDKFDDDPSDCILGYVEHHGWDWSRSAEGLVVSARGLGSFTVILAGDGSLTGVRRHG